MAGEKLKRGDHHLWWRWWSKNWGGHSWHERRNRVQERTEREDWKESWWEEQVNRERSTNGDCFEADHGGQPWRLWEESRETLGLVREKKIAKKDTERRRAGNLNKKNQFSLKIEKGLPLSTVWLEKLSRRERNWWALDFFTWAHQFCVFPYWEERREGKGLLFYSFPFPPSFPISFLHLAITKYNPMIHFWATQKCTRMQIGSQFWCIKTSARYKSFR